MAPEASERTYRDTVLVLRTYPLGEADRIVVALSSGHGLVRAVVKGVRRSSAKWGGRLEPFMLTDVALVRGRNLETVTQAVTNRAWAAPIVEDWDAYLCASAVCEVAEHLAQADAGENHRLFVLTAGAVSALARRLHAPEDVLGSWLVRAMVLSGWSMSLDRCARCGRGDRPLRSWSRAEGGMVCDEDRGPGDRPVPEAEARHLRALGAGDWPALAAERDPSAAAAAGRRIRDYVQWHVERAFRSFALLERPL